MRAVTVAATQAACGPDVAANLDQAEALVREAVGAGADLVLLQELFATEYFCKDERAENFALAEEFATSGVVRRFAALARELAVVLPVPFFEKAGPSYFNSVAVIDSDGTVLGCYRKSHIPDGPGYEEKYYFSPGDTGFRAFVTTVGVIGVGICWDQWFPEAARAMTLAGADVLFYPTAIGSEPHDTSLDTARLWRRAMVGHAVSNVVPVVAANRVGTEHDQTFYGTSFICDERGDVLAELDREEEGVITATLDLALAKRHRAAFGFFRDRRPELYGRLVEDI